MRHVDFHVRAPVGSSEKLSWEGGNLLKLKSDGTFSDPLVQLISLAGTYTGHDRELTPGNVLRSDDIVLVVWPLHRQL